MNEENIHLAALKRDNAESAVKVLRQKLQDSQQELRECRRQFQELQRKSQGTEAELRMRISMDFASLQDALRELHPDRDVEEGTVEGVLEDKLGGDDDTAEGFTFGEYDAEAAVTAVYPDFGLGVPVYPAIGLSGEVGELLEIFKKAMRDAPPPSAETSRRVVQLHAIGQTLWPEELFAVGVPSPLNDEQRGRALLELGDILWYVSAITRSLDSSLEEVARQNVEKLRSRKARGVLGGSGSLR